MLTDPERKIIAKNFFDKAINSNLIVFKTPSQFNSKTKKIHHNIQISAITYYEFKQIYDDEPKFQKFCRQNEIQFNVKPIYSKRLIENFFLHHALSYYEAYKLFLLEILKHGTKIGKKRNAIGPTMELGKIVVSLCQELQYDDFEKLFSREFRNILGHSSWWRVGEYIIYEQNNVEYKMSFTHFNELMSEFGKNMDQLVTEYYSRKPLR